MCDVVRALDRYGADGPRHRVTLLVDDLEPGPRCDRVEVIVHERIQECGYSVPPSEKNRGAHAVRLPPRLLLLRMRLRPAADPGCAQYSSRSGGSAKKRPANTSQAKQCR
ncbi:hypothetical protein [Streptomyces xanthochromogenes]|uniref:hypothetical protein n=1 Tax=Streptomyces xanthochromogenes TaxID=67384 RepID=UPI0016785AE5|nr:hypothetical protein [Streptomyces xanthochromogenes]